MSKRAIRQLDRITEYYYSQSPDAGSHFEAAVVQALRELTGFSSGEVKYKNVRIKLVRPFHNWLHYRVNEQAGLVTVAAAYDDRGLGKA